MMLETVKFQSLYTTFLRDRMLQTKIIRATFIHFHRETLYKKEKKKKAETCTHSVSNKQASLGKRKNSLNALTATTRTGTRTQMGLLQGFLAASQAPGAGSSPGVSRATRPSGSQRGCAAGQDCRVLAPRSPRPISIVFTGKIQRGARPSAACSGQCY